MRTLALCAGLLLVSTAANAAQFQDKTVGSYTYVHVVCDIEPDDYYRLKMLVAFGALPI